MTTPPQDRPSYGEGPPTGYPPPPAYQAPPSQEVPGRTLGIVGLVLSFFTAIVGLIVSIIALRQSKKAGHGNGPAVAGIVVGALTTVLAAVGIIVAIIAFATVAQKCQQLGPGVHKDGNVTYTCS